MKNFHKLGFEMIFKIKMIKKFKIILLILY